MLNILNEKEEAPIRRAQRLMAKKGAILFLLFTMPLLFTGRAGAEGETIVRIRSGTVFDGKLYRNLHLNGIKIIPGMEDYVKSMMEWHLKGKRVSFKFDKKMVDRGGRLLVYMYCPNTGFKFAGGSRYYNDVVIDNKRIFLNAYLVGQGYAMPTGSSSNKSYNELFQKLYKEAKRNKAGAWAYVGKNGKLRLKK